LIYQTKIVVNIVKNLKIFVNILMCYSSCELRHIYKKKEFAIVK